MRTFKLPFVLLAFLVITSSLWAQKEKPQWSEKADTRIDNNGYWKRMAEKGLTKLNPMVSVPKAVYTGSAIDARSSVTLDSPDVPVTTESSTQSENSVFVNPQDPQNIVNSNNSTDHPDPTIYGANDLRSFDGGLTWMGEITGAGEDNNGDPAVVIGNNGWYYINYIKSGANLGQQMSYSTDQGASWNTVIIDEGASSSILDKNHFWIDNGLSSPYEGHLYCAWTDFGGPHDEDIALSYSSDEGLSWSTAVNISADVNALSHCQGVNINTGPNGKVYAVFAIYDYGGGDEIAYGFSSSLDGGATWEPAVRIIEDVKGIRNSLTSKNMRVNSFPVLAVDISDGMYSGNLYMVWTNIGTPGINTGPDIDIYMIRSEDQGDTWSDPIRVNQDEAGLGHEHYFPWITSDPVLGTLSVIFYDDRNVGGNQCEVFCANSYDGGENWEDFKVSDVAFTPTPMPGYADDYMGDYLGISARDSYVYPIWTDNRTGTTMSYVSPYETNDLSMPYELIAILDDATGSVDLVWQYDPAPGFLTFIIYRNGVEIAQTLEQNYPDQLPEHDIYKYQVSAYYEIEGESIPATAYVQWGNPQIFVTPAELEQTLGPDSSAIQYLSITNTGELDLHYNIFTQLLTDKDVSLSYCEASGGCDEFIENVSFGDINNTTACDEYGDYTNLSTDINIGETIPLSVTNGSAYTGDSFGVWVDWNQNDDFTDDEAITIDGGPEIFTADITAPENAVGGMTRMRVRIQYGGTPEPCGITSFGEVEDYSINVNSWLAIDSKEGNILPGETQQVEVTFNSSGLDLGDYSAEFHINSNDPNLPLVNVPVTLHVAEFAVVGSASPPSACYGDEVQLDVEVVGGLGSYAYTWTSDPPGFNSTLKNPTHTPLENTAYIIHAADGVNSGTDTVMVEVFPYPELSIGPDTVICPGDAIIIDAGPDHTTYEWQDGSIGQTFTASEEGLYWVEVSNEYGCHISDSLLLIVQDPAQQPAKPAGPSLIDLYETQMTTYETSLAPDAQEYQWEIIPAEAAEIQNNGHQAVLNWDTTYVGQAQLKVLYVNLCGSSPWSESLMISVVNTTGIAELEDALGLEIYPNPNQGSFNMSFNASKDIYVNIHISTPSGATIFKRKNKLVSGKQVEQVNLRQNAAGIYTIVIEGVKDRIIRQVIVTE